MSDCPSCDRLSASLAPGASATCPCGTLLRAPGGGKEAREAQSTGRHPALSPAAALEALAGHLPDPEARCG